MSPSVAVRSGAQPLHHPIAGRLAGQRTDNLMARAAIAALFSLFFTAVTILAVRRVAGALDRPLTSIGLLLVGAILAAAAAAVRMASQVDFRTAGPERWLGPLTSLGLLCSALVLCIPGTSLLGLGLLWSIVGFEEAVFWGFYLSRAGKRKDTPSDGREGPPVHSLDAALDAAMLDGSIVQHLVRRKQLDGSEMLVGFVRTAFAAGQRSAAAHVAFCPPLAVSPAVMAEPVAGPPARLRVAQALPQGIRLEIKLDQAVQSADEVLTEFSAWENPPLNAPQPQAG